jgi:hypothetical protein
MTAAQTTTQKKRRTPRPLTPAQKVEAITLWRAGSVTLDELSKRFKKDPSTFSRLFAAEKVKKGENEKEHTEKVKAAVEQAMVDDSTELARRIKETREETYKCATLAQRLSYALIVQARQEKRPMGTLVNDFKALKLFAEVQKMSAEQRFLALGVDPDEDNGERPPPELLIQELTAEDIREMHRKSMVADDDGEDMDNILGDESLIAPLEDDFEDDRVEVDG